MLKWFDYEIVHEVPHGSPRGKECRLAEFLVRRIENIETGEEKRGYSSVFTIFHHLIEVIAEGVASVGNGGAH